MTTENYPEELAFTPLEWKTDMDLTPGTVLRFWHELHPDNITIFECTGPRGGKATSGRMTTQIDGVFTEITEATVSTLHPIPFMAQQNTPHIELTLQKDNEKIRITPAFTNAERAFNGQLAQELIETERQRLNHEPFDNENAQTVLTKAAALLTKLASEATDQEHALKYSSASEVIHQELLVK